MNELSWDEYFLAIVEVASKRSKDPNTKVGAVLVNENNVIVGTGYNGMPRGNDNFPWTRTGAKNKDVKYSYVVHAELNAILNANAQTRGTTIYVSLFPCSNCAKFIAQAGIKEIKYSSDKYRDTEDNQISKYILKECGVKLTKLDPIIVDIRKGL